MSTEKRFVGFYEDHELPLKRGQMVTIKKGTMIKTVGRPAKPAGKTYKITIHHFLPGITRPETKIDYDVKPPKANRVLVHESNPMVVWPGPGGYWSEVDINDIPEAVNAPPSLAEAVRRIDLPANEWAGNCYALACYFVKYGLVKGTAVYGHWTGEVHPESYFGARAHSPFIQHGWVLLENGNIVDPTRWAFEAKEPYIHIGPPSSEYDEGGNQFKAALRRPPPSFNPDDQTVELTSGILPTAPWKFLEDLLRIDISEQEPGRITIEQLFWVANLPVRDLGRHAEAIYSAFEKVGMGAAIPKDNREMVRRLQKVG